MTDIENCQKEKLTIDLGWANVFAFQSVIFLEKEVLASAFGHWMFLVVVPTEIKNGKN